jgi:IS605 OrfB family transposase
MKKRKKKNIERAFALKNNILKHNNKITLPNKNDIKFINKLLINSINTSVYSNNQIFIDKPFDLNLQIDDLINGRKTKDVLIKTYKILLLPNSKQKKLLLGWMDDWIDMYNKVISFIKNERKKQSLDKNTSLKYNQINLNNLELNKLKKDLHQYKKELCLKNGIDSHTLDYCINDVLTMLKSSITNINCGNIKKSKLRYIKKTKKSKIFKIENNGTSITSKSFFTSKLGKFIKSNPMINYKKANGSMTTIQYKNGKFYMLIKKKVKMSEHLIKEKKIISLDPGHKTFLTGLSNDHLIEIGKNIDKKIKKRLIKMDMIKKQKRKKVKQKRKYLLKHEKKLSNCINNLHWQVVNYLTSNYNHILLGNYSTKEMVENDKANKMNKRIGSSFKFYKFREKLIYKCILKGCEFGLIDEYNTTKACSNCSTLNNIGSSREYKCKHCLHLYPRDINSSKNILLRSIQ